MDKLTNASDYAWALVRPLTEAEKAADQTHGVNIVYMLGRSAKEVWESVIESEWMGTGQTRESLKALGFRARRVHVIVMGE